MKLILVVVFFCGIHCVEASTTAISPTDTNATTGAPSTTYQSCEDSSSCADCTKDIKCYWCGANDACKEYPESKIVPRDCAGNKWYWKQCAVAGYVLIIVVPSVCGVVLLSIGCCIYCWCCRSRSSRKYDRADGNFRRKREELRQRNSERRAERRLKTDAIRKKYGLLKDDDDDDDDDYAVA